MIHRPLSVRQAKRYPVGVVCRFSFARCNCAQICSAETN